MPRRTNPRSLAPAYAFDEEARIFVPEAAHDDLDYSDGDATEEGLLSLMRQASDLSLHSLELAARAVDWPTLYHLSPIRANLLRPFERHLRGRTLEVGSGCGALTRYLGELGGQVVALEGSRRRATITAARCRGLDNVTVVHDRLERFATDQRFTAITLVGVLEWASRFGDENGARRLLEQAAGLLTDEGVLIIAIENQLGLKYLAGWPEDHLGVAMYGVNDAYRPGEPRTFGLRDLTELVSAAGLPHHAVYAPLPDYKFPRSVVTPSGLDDREWSRDLAAIAVATPVTDPQAPILPLFSLEQALGLAARNGILRELSNAFVVVAGREPVGRDDDGSILAWHFSGNRRPRYLRETRFRRSARGITLEHRPLAPKAAAAQLVDGAIRHREAVDEYVTGEVWTMRLGPILNTPGWTIADVALWAAPWRDALAAAAGLRKPSAAAQVPPHLVDATPFNMVHGDGQFRFFDREWEPPWRVEYGYVLYRGLFWSLLRLRSVAEPAEGVPHSVSALCSAVAAALGTPTSPADESRYLDIEADVQHQVTGVAREKAREDLRRPRLPVRPRLEALAGLEAEVRSLREVYRQVSADRDELQREVDRHQLALQQAIERGEAEREQAARLQEAAVRRQEEAARQIEETSRQQEETARQLEEATRKQQETTRQLEEATRRLDESARAHAQIESMQTALRTALQARLDELEKVHHSTASALDAAIAERDEARSHLHRAREEAAALDARMQNAQQLTVEQAGRIRAAQVALKRERADGEQRNRRVAAAAAQAIAGASGDGAPNASRTRAIARARKRLHEALLPPRSIVRQPVAFATGLARLASRPYRAQVALLADSLLFDAAHYQAVTGVAPGPDMLAHFFRAGDVAGHSPHPLFDAAWYRAQNPDLPATDGALMHYLRHGGWELRDPHPLFDTRYYLAQWPAETVHTATPLSHFLRVGFLGAASPHPLFDAGYYMSQRPALAGARANPLVHYLATAATELLDPHPLFSTRHYLEAHPDLGAANPLDHFVRHGASEGRSPHPLFDIGYYWEQRPDVRASGVNPLLHYLRHALDEDVDPHPLFDTSFYIDQAPDLRELGINPLVHFLRWGWRDGLRPNPWFDPQWYLDHNPDLEDVNPLVHYVCHGGRENRDPSAEFSLSSYLAANPDVAAMGQDGLQHYLRHGQREGRQRALAVDGVNTDAAPEDFSHLLGTVAQDTAFRFWMHRADGTPAEIAASIQSLTSQHYPRWSLDIVTTDDVPFAQLQEAALEDPRVRINARPLEPHVPEDENGRRVYAARLRPGDVLDPHALLLAAYVLDGACEIDLVYADEDTLGPEGRRDPVFKPDWDPLLLASTDYLGPAAFVACDLLHAALAQAASPGTASDHDLLRRALAGTPRERTVHLPYLLAHTSPRHSFAARNSSTSAALEPDSLPALAERLYGPTPPTATAPLVSIIVPTRNGRTLLSQCVESVLARTAYPAFEVVVVDNGSDEDDCLAYLASLAARPGCRVVRSPGPFNYSALNNLAAVAAKGELYCLLNNDIEIRERSWLSQMVSFARQPGVGAVGTNLYYPDGTIQHAGVVLGAHGVAGHAFVGKAPGEPTYMNLAWVPREISAVTGACMVVARDRFQKVGGLDERDLRVNFSDIDFCLKLRSLGYTNVILPLTGIVHHESATRGAELRTPNGLAQLEREATVMKQRWGACLSEDPYYNGNLSLTESLYGVAHPARVRLPQPGSHGRRLPSPDHSRSRVPVRS